MIDEKEAPMAKRGGSKKTTAKKTTAKKTTRRSSPRAQSGRGPGESTQGQSAQGASAATSETDDVTAKPTSDAADLDKHNADAGLSSPAPRRRESTARPSAVRRNEAPAPVGIPGEEINRFAETGRQRRRARAAGVAPPAPTFGPEVESEAADTIFDDVPRSRPKIGKSK